MDAAASPGLLLTPPPRYSEPDPHGCEIREEASIEVKNIRYFGSQPWPFPSNLMIGFLAEYESGELRPDGSEVVESGWFVPDALPALPPPGSIARRMIDLFVSGQTTG